MSNYQQYSDLSQPNADTAAPDTGAQMPWAASSSSQSAQVQGAAPNLTSNSNVQTLIRLVSDLPEGVTKQTGAQIIRLTMEAMGISMEEVLTEAQNEQSSMMEAQRVNIRKIEELKAVIRKLEADNRLYLGKANELSEIIDLFVLSNPSSSGMGQGNRFTPSSSYASPRPEASHETSPSLAASFYQAAASTTAPSATAATPSDANDD